MEKFRILKILGNVIFVVLFFINSTFCHSKNFNEVDSLAKKFAPILIFHEDESHYPVDINYFLKNSALVEKNKRYFKLQIDALINYSKVQKFDSLSKAYYFYKKNESYIEVTYWFLYLYNGSISKYFPTHHEGDWEHIKIRISTNTKSIDSIYFAAHDSYKWVKKDNCDFDIVDIERPIVYVSLNSHASYEKPRKHKRGKFLKDLILPDDKTSSKGFKWSSKNDLVYFGDNKILNEMIYWGNQITPLIKFINGPISPFYQD